MNQHQNIKKTLGITNKSLNQSHIQEQKLNQEIKLLSERLRRGELINRRLECIIDDERITLKILQNRNQVYVRNIQNLKKSVIDAQDDAAEKLQIINEQKQTIVHQQLSIKHLDNVIKSNHKQYEKRIKSLCQKFEQEKEIARNIITTQRKRNNILNISLQNAVSEHALMETKTKILTKQVKKAHSTIIGLEEDYSELAKNFSNSKKIITTLNENNASLLLEVTQLQNKIMSQSGKSGEMNLPINEYENTKNNINYNHDKNENDNKGNSKNS